jgi:hypothetical protein
MPSTVWAVVRNGKIEFLEGSSLPEGAKVLVTLVPDGAGSWLGASQGTLDAIWQNDEDDVYAKLLKKVVSSLSAIHFPICLGRRFGLQSS